MIDIDWSSFLVVAGVVLLATVLLTACYAGGVRLLAVEGRPGGAARLGAAACFAVCIAAVLLGLWTIVPQFH